MISNLWMIMKMFICIFLEKKVPKDQHEQTCGDKMTSCGNRREESAGFGANCFSIRNEENKN